MTYFNSLKADDIKVYLDPQIRLVDPTQPLKVDYAGWWIFRSLEIANSCCAWPGEE